MSFRNVPEPSKRGKISATFIDLSRRTHLDKYLLDLNYDQWCEELTDMQAAGITTVIPARTMIYGCTYHFSDHFETWHERDTLTPLMEACRDTKMPIYLSGQINNQFWNVDDKNFDRLCKRDTNISKVLFNELYEQYGDVAPIAGFYVSYEPDQDNCRNTSREDSLKHFCTNTYKNLKAIAPDLPVLTSPFFSLRFPPAELASWWDSFLTERMFDVVAMQDGVGCTRNLRPEHVVDYYPGFKEVMDKHDMVFWNNVETFIKNPSFDDHTYTTQEDITTLVSNDLRFYSAPKSRYDKQYELGEEYVTRTITWEFGNFLSKRYAGEDIYNEFKEWNLAVAKADPVNSKDCCEAIK
ncbi:hypothetical protein KS4_00960 [Poriferisphaera corsica]|uniref:DUF4434 domain-containing protein n=1 Tax=Poriferisphaera corsica TaxID=2528020 RepID=A0A517YPB8_9BACT|nr:DUF4434 domain-containing protein [Poriferisphaera corsica]QDU32067.1 hypothetical protein KS4_00960 [Poriferisphaera corsica]